MGTETGIGSLLVTPVRLQPLVATAFAPFGDVLQPGSVLLPETDDGRVGVEVIELASGRFDPGDLRTVALHFSYSQIFVVLAGNMALVVAPRPSGPADDAGGCVLDYAGLAAFELGPGEGVMVGKGVWHQPVPLDGPVRFLNITRKDSGEPASPLASHRAYIEHVDLAVRDARSIRIVGPDEAR
jgi:ureidoglycolate hydrolase